MADATEFKDTQVAQNGERYRVEDIEKVNADLAKDGKTSVKSPTFENKYAVQEGNVADGKTGDELSGDHTPGTPNEAKSADESKKMTAERSRPSREA